MGPADVISTEDFIEHSVRKTEIKALKWALKYWDNPNGKEMVEQYVKELEEEDE